MKYLDEIKKWPIEKKRNFSIIVAVFLTLLIVGLNYGVGLVWKEPVRESIFSGENNPINKLSESFKRNLEIIQPMLDKAFGTNSVLMSSTTKSLLEDMASTTSSSSTSSNVVR